MKRYIILLLALLLVFLAGCSLPAVNDVPETSSALQTTENTQVNSTVNPEAAAKTDPADNSKTEAADNGTKTAKIPVTLYYQDADGFLIPLARWIDKQQGIARAAVSGLIDSAITREELQYYGVYPVLPVNTDILGINIKEGVATIDFNTHFLEYKDEAAERNVIASVVYTMTEFKTINDVRILVNGFEQKKLKYGTDISALLNRSNIVINTQDSSLKNGMAKADIYFFKRANEGFTYLLPVSVECGNTNGKAAPEEMVRLLLNGKADDKLQSEMPTGAGLIDSSTNDGVLSLNFDGKFIEYGGSAKEEGLLKQLMYTIKQADDITKVKILINGKPAELPEGTDISKGLAIPKTINDVIDTTN